jgi:hypothetical protein
MVRRKGEMNRKNSGSAWQDLRMNTKQGIDVVERAREGRSKSKRAWTANWEGR